MRRRNDGGNVNRENMPEEATKSFLHSKIVVEETLTG